MKHRTVRLLRSLPALASAACCHAVDAVNSSDRATTAVTFNRDIAPIIFKQCANCHRPNQPGPFNLLTYSDVQKRARQIAEVTAKRTMPPWLLEAGYGEFKEERRLSEKEILLFQKWFETGAAEGNPADRPPTPHWPEGWQWGQPDLVLQLPEPFTLREAGPDVWRNFVIPAPLPTNRYVRAIEFRPGNKCIHHAAMRLDRTPQSRLRDESDPGPGFDGITPPDTARPPAGHMLNWLPGRVGYRSPEGMSWPFEKGADLVVQLHMQTTGKPETVQPSIGLYFTEQAPTNQLFVFPLMVRSIDIPAGSTNYVVEDAYKLSVDLNVTWINPHAHYIAREMKGYALLPDGTRRSLFLIRNWDFNWQGDFAYREPVFLPKGSELHMEYSYDNSTNNVRNPNNPPRRVLFGQQSTDEMAELWIQGLPRDQKERAILERDFQRKLLTEMTNYYSFKLRLDPADARAHCRLGFANLQLGNRTDAAEHLKHAIELDPRDEEPHLYLGTVWLQESRLPSAQGEFEAALRLNPNSYLAHGNLGLVHMNQGHLNEARTHLEAALRLNPNDVTARQNLRIVTSALAARKPSP